MAVHPLTLTAAAGAARIGTGLQTALTVLRGGKLVIVRETGGTRFIEPYLTRIAEAVCAALSAGAPAGDPRADRHRPAARPQDRSRNRWLSISAAAGEGGRAANTPSRRRYRAREALAFDREVELLRLVLELDAGGDLAELRQGDRHQAAVRRPRRLASTAAAS